MFRINIDKDDGDSLAPMKVGCTRLIKHRNTGCTCVTCVHDWARLPPPVTKAEELESYRFIEREIKKAKAAAKKEIKKGTQASITSFFGTKAADLTAKKKTVKKHHSCSKYCAAK